MGLAILTPDTCLTSAPRKQAWPSLTRVCHVWRGTGLGEMGRAEGALTPSAGLKSALARSSLACPLVWGCLSGHLLSPASWSALAIAKCSLPGRPPLLPHHPALFSTFRISETSGSQGLREGGKQPSPLPTGTLFLFLRCSSCPSPGLLSAPQVQSDNSQPSSLPVIFSELNIPCRVLSSW